jgi:hypothetical protein
MAVSILPVALGLSALALVIFGAFVSPKHLLFLKSCVMVARDAYLGHAKPFSKGDGTNKDRKWGSMILI